MSKIDLASIRIKNIKAVFPVQWSANDRYKMNDRKGTGLIFVEKGVLQYRIDGKTCVSDQYHMLLLPYQTTYSILSVTDSVSLLIDIQADGYDYIGATINSYRINATSSFVTDFYKLDNIWTFKKGAYHFRCLSIIYDMLARVQEMDSLPYAPDQKFNQIEDSINYLENNYCDPLLTNDALADQSNISTVYFRKLFSEKYGISPMMYVKKKRIEKAKEMLKGDFASITQIAEAVGYANINNFSRSFKNATGYSPLEYKRIQ